MSTSTSVTRTKMTPAERKAATKRTRKTTATPTAPAAAGTCSDPECTHEHHSAPVAKNPPLPKEVKEPKDFEELVSRATRQPTGDDLIIGFDKVTGQYREDGKLDNNFSFLSIQYPCTFQDTNGVTFRSLEQYLWYMMAKVAHDEVAMARFLEVKTTKQMNEVNKSIKGLNAKNWDEMRFQLCVDGVAMKFDQNLALSQQLRATSMLSHDRFVVLAYVSPKNKQWSTGSTSVDPSTWKSNNLLGKAHMVIRDLLHAKHQSTTPATKPDQAQMMEDMKKDIAALMAQEGYDVPLESSPADLEDLEDNWEEINDLVEEVRQDIPSVDSEDRSPAAAAAAPELTA